VLTKACFIESPNKENRSSVTNNAEKRPIQTSNVLTSAPATSPPRIMEDRKPSSQWPTRMLEEERESEISASNGANTDRLKEQEISQKSESEFDRDGLDDLNYDNMADYNRAEKKGTSAAA
jgi:hypothetical protein